VFNTQEITEIIEDFDFDDLIMNHVIQGTQDVTNILLRGRKIFGMVSGHFQDKDTNKNLLDWLYAAATVQYAKKSKVGLLGNPAQDMGDFGVDESSMKTRWGPHAIYLSLGRFNEILMNIEEDQINEIVTTDKEVFDFDDNLSEETYRTSVKLELAFRKLIKEKDLDAFTMNFMDIVSDGRFPTIPFLGINKLLSDGYGYAGEGNLVIAALMSQMHHLCGGANFTETFTVDFKRNIILMSHMQECNPAFARKDRKVKLVHKDFWAKGIGPYAGMHFSLEPSPVTLITITTKPDGSFYYICYETQICDILPLKNFDIPHWFIQPDEDVGKFLSRYSMVGGPHHLISVPGHCTDKIKKLAFLQNFDCTIL
jgi:L-arabinose isomerase